MFTFYITDLLFYLLLIAFAVLIGIIARRPHLREPWTQVLSRSVGMASLTLLMVFVAVALIASIHIHPAVTDAQGHVQRYRGSVESVLDVILAPLEKHPEKTYSAPFAAHLYVQEVVHTASGKDEQVYPRLTYGGAQLDHPASQRLPDIARRCLRGLGWGLLGFVVFAFLCLLARSLTLRRAPRRTATEIWRGDTAVCWRTLLTTAALIGVFCAMATVLAGGYHILGTDKVGQDVFVKTVKSIRTGVLIGTLTTLVTLPFGLLLGPMAGYFRGWVDDLIQYVYTTLSSIPGVLLIAAAVLMLQVYMQNHADLFATTGARAELRLLFLCLILGVTSWTSLCRLLRAETLKLSQMEYVQAATALGVGHFRILQRHVLPNVMHIVLIQVVIDFSGLVLAEAVLSYIGVGVDPTMDSWGNMINSARLELARDPIVWWPLAAAFVFMLTLVLAANLFADVVRDAFDPRERGGAG